MKRFILPVILMVALIVAAGFVARTALAATKDATLAVTVTVPTYVAIDPPPAMTIAVVTPGTEATGTSVFNLNANVATTISVGTITQPTGLTGLTGTVAPTSTASAASTPVTLTGKITVPINVAAGTYTGGVITVTVTYTP